MDVKKVYFFGVISPNKLGHFIYPADGHYISPQERRSLPFSEGILDAGLLPRNVPERQGDLYLSVINGWTILGMWDRTGDKRGQSNASFLAEGVHTIEEMKEIAAKEFPEIWDRIQKPWN